MKSDFLTGLIFILMWVTTQQTFGQAEDGSASSENKHLSQNEVSINQVGVNNEAYIQQVSTSGVNVIDVLQSGHSNFLNLTHLGLYTAIRVTQDGTRNFYEADIDGQNVKMDINQHGFENFISQSLLLNNSGFTIIQEGDRNEIIHNGSSSNATGIQIHQQGFGMKLIIQSN